MLYRLMTLSDLEGYFSYWIVSH